MKRLLVATMLTASFASIGSDKYLLNDWVDTPWSSKEGASVVNRTSETGIDMDLFVFEGIIASNLDGKQNLYFQITNISDGKFISSCSPSTNGYEHNETGDNYMRDTTWTINNQNVKMIVFCNERSDGTYYPYATAETNAGKDFVVNAFKKSNAVRISGGDFNVNLTAKGFSKTWNSYGGDAI